MHTNKLAERRFQLLNSIFQVVLVCGPSRVGKTTT